MDWVQREEMCRGDHRRLGTQQSRTARNRTKVYKNCQEYSPLVKPNQTLKAKWTAHDIHATPTPFFCLWRGTKFWICQYPGSFCPQCHSATTHEKTWPVLLFNNLIPLKCTCLLLFLKLHCNRHTVSPGSIWDVISRGSENAHCGVPQCEHYVVW
jgi:hypothetical protein